MYCITVSVTVNPFFWIPSWDFRDSSQDTTSLNMFSNQPDIVELLVHGMIRRMETYHCIIIPMDIKYLFYIFYGIPDRFEYACNQIALSDHRSVMTKRHEINGEAISSGYGNSTFGRKLIDSNLDVRAKWTLNVRDDGTDGRNGSFTHIVIGIVDSRFTEKPIHWNHAWYLTAMKECAFYACQYSSGDHYGVRSRRFDDGYTTSEGFGFKKGQNITIKLNTEMQTLIITNRNESAKYYSGRVSFQDIICDSSVQYRLAVTLFAPGDCIELVSFEEDKV